MHENLIGKPVEKLELRKSRHRWEDNIKADLVQPGLVPDSFQWLDFVNSVIKLSSFI
jgi:hypothetical protein